MKLDNIIYDVDTLATALTNQFIADSPVFNAMYPSDTATALVQSLAAYGSMLQYSLLGAAANSYTNSAYSDNGIYQLASTLGNSLRGNSPSQLTVSITKTNFLGMDIVVPAKTVFEVQSKKFYNPAAILLPAVTNTVSNIALCQGEVLTTSFETSGLKNEKFYFSSDFKADLNNVKVYVNDQAWSVSESFLAYDNSYIQDTTSAYVVVVKMDNNGKAYVQVGDGQLGILPASGSVIKVEYLSNDGELGNITESGISGTLVSNLLFIDGSHLSSYLTLDIVTTSTAYGGVGTQSIETLRETSPLVFASGNRAIRRDDYNAMLQNKCGYLTTSVWGEYEESAKTGTADAIMMNMVYYTGIKTYEVYPYFSIGTITNPASFQSALYTSSGFWGSFSIQIKSNTNLNNTIDITDTGAKGQLFINNNQTDKRDSLLPEWIAQTTTIYDLDLASPSIIEAGTGYAIGDILELVGVTTLTRLKVLTIGEDGVVGTVSLQTYTSTVDESSSHPDGFATTYLSGTSGNGTGLVVNVTYSARSSSPLVVTNDDRGIIPPPTQLNPIENARSDKAQALYYQSLWTPTLLQPVQIILNYSSVQKAIAGIKFQAVNDTYGPFAGTMAMFGTNIDPMPSLENIRNSEDWACVINRTVMTSPFGNLNDSWTNWYPTNCFTGEMTANNLPIYNKYRYYVIEFYNCDAEPTVIEPKLTLGKIKLLYDDDASVIYYSHNSTVQLKLPTIGSPGPDAGGTGYLTTSLLNTTEFPMYKYSTTISGITYSNGYRNGNILAYVYTDPVSQAQFNFLVRVSDIDNGVFYVTCNNSDSLTGTATINLTEPTSLDATVVYNEALNTGINIPTEQGGSGYKPNDIVSIDGTNNVLQLRVVTTDTYGTVKTVVWVNNTSVGTNYTGTYATSLYIASTGSTGTGLTVSITGTATSGTGDVLGSGATLNISSADNLSVETQFIGNRIDEQNINFLDQPIINKYNHFTTFLEFCQPEIIQQGITINVSLNPTSSRTSALIIQDIKNKVAELFAINSKSIGRGLKLSDLYYAVKQISEVEWCKVIEPLDNVNILPYGLMVYSHINVIEVTGT